MFRRMKLAASKIGVSLEFTHLDPKKSDGVHVNFKTGAGLFTITSLDAAGLHHFSNALYSDGDNPVKIPTDRDDKDYYIEVETEVNDEGGEGVDIIIYNGVTQFRFYLEKCDRESLALAFASWADDFIKR